MVGEKMNFYSFSENCGSKYVSIIDILNMSDLSFGSCSKCGAEKLVKWGDIIPVFECETITKHRQLPDIMLYGGSMLQSFDAWSIVSENFKRLFEHEEFIGASFYPIELVFKKRGEYHKLENQYYVMSIIGRAEIDFEAMGLKCSICDSCLHYIFDGDYCPLFTKKGVYPTIIKNGSWDGSDVFNHNDCTERFVQKILEADLSGFEFLCFEQKYDSFEKKKYFRTLNGLNRIKSQR